MSETSFEERTEEQQAPPAAPSRAPGQTEPSSPQDGNGKAADGRKPRDAQSPPDDPQRPAKPPFYKRPRILLIAGIALLAIIVIGLLWWLHARHFESTDDAFIDGDVVEISPQVAGHLTAVYVNDNQFVRKGEPIAQIDPRDYQARVNQAQAALESAVSKEGQAQAQVNADEANIGAAEADVVAAQAETARTQSQLERYNSLPPAAVSRQDVENVQAAAKNARAQLDAARKRLDAAKAQRSAASAQIAVAQAGIVSAKADLATAQLNLSYTHLAAPSDGFVSRKSAEVGAYVQPGQVLLAMVLPDMWVTANFKETQLTYMRVGQPVTIHIDRYSHSDLQGHVDSIQAGTGARFSLLPPENATGNYVKVVQRIPVKILIDTPPDAQHPLAIGLSVEPKVKVR